MPPLWFLVSHRHICAIPHFATYRAIALRYPIKTSTEEFCDTIATSIARYQKYRCWASKTATPLKLNPLFRHPETRSLLKLPESFWIVPETLWILSIVPEGPTIQKKSISDRIFQSRSKISILTSRIAHKNGAAVGGALENFILARKIQSRSKSRFFFLIFGPSAVLRLQESFFRLSLALAIVDLWQTVRKCR